MEKEKEMDRCNEGKKGEGRNGWLGRAYIREGRFLTTLYNIKKGTEEEKGKEIDSLRKERLIHNNFRLCNNRNERREKGGNGDR